MNSMLIRQNWSYAIRRELGYPGGTPVLHTLAFATGPSIGVGQGVQISQVAADMGRDVIFTAWDAFDDRRPAGMALALRYADHVAWIAPCFLWAPDAETPLVIVPVHGDEHYALGGRGWLERRSGRPAKAATGRRLATRRVAATAAAMDGPLNDENRWIAPGKSWADSLRYGQLVVTPSA